MKYVVEAGTDAASIVLFDPRALPEGFDEAVSGDDPVAIVSELADAGRIFWTDSGGDGSYLLHAYVNEDVPAELRPYLRDTIDESHQFAVSGGCIYFTGIEYAFRNDDSFLKKYSHMGGAFPIENGTYVATLYRAEFPPTTIPDTYRKRATSMQRFVHGAYDVLVTLAFLTVVAMIGTFFFMTWRAWLTFVVPMAVLSVALSWILYRLPAFRSSDKIWREVHREFPDFVVTLSAKGDGGE
jgi:hypothetical protein